ncbi:MAG: flagellar hook-basal body complex protein FliE [Christensenellales bacterium]|jgi:flagellar hook-basal body complex protein FliE
MSVESIKGVLASAQGFSQRTQGVQQNSQGSFSNILSEAIDAIKQTEAEAAEAAAALLTGESTDLHTALIAAQKAEIAISYTVEIRNRILEAYNNIMNMQV